MALRETLQRILATYLQATNAPLKGHPLVFFQDGPEEKAGELRFRMSALSSRLDATLSVAGVECSFQGQLSDSYTGTMTCPDREAVPLKLWVK